MTSQRISYLEVTPDARRSVMGGVVDEVQACISLNGQELTRIMCSPGDIDELVVGFLKSEGFIDSLQNVRSIHVSDNSCVEVWLDHSVAIPIVSTKTSGCGGGITFDDMSANFKPLVSKLQVSAGQVCDLMNKMMRAASTYNDVRGIHTSALCSPTELLYLAEDVGRHNTIDRLWGSALRRRCETRETILVASGRISSEMIGKAMKMSVPVVVSRTSPTALSVALARAWNITVIGYCRGHQFRIYSGEQRITT